MNPQTTLLQLLTQLRVLHWQTTKYARHMAFGTAYTTLDPLVDSFVEGYLGIDGTRLSISNIELKNLGQLEPTEFCNEAISHIKELKEKVSDYPDLTNTSDEMIAVFGKLKYLLTLK